MFHLLLLCNFIYGVDPASMHVCETLLKKEIGDHVNGGERGGHYGGTNGARPRLVDGGSGALFLREIDPSEFDEFPILEIE